MALSYLERFKMITDPQLAKRVSVCVWNKALAILDDPASTPEDKTEARARLKRPVNDAEARVALTRISGDLNIVADPTDDQLQTATNKAYNSLPEP